MAVGVEPDGVTELNAEYVQVGRLRETTKRSTKQAGTVFGTTRDAPGPWQT